MVEFDPAEADSGVENSSESIEANMLKETNMLRESSSHWRLCAEPCA